MKLGHYLWTTLGSLILLLLSLAVVILIIVKLPATFFLESHDRNFWVDQHPCIRWTGRLLKNLAGISLVMLGVFLSVPGIPGQGLLTVLIGLTLVDFPGKRRVERAFLARPSIITLMNRLRARFGQPPLQLQ